MLLSGRRETPHAGDDLCPYRGNRSRGAFRGSPRRQAAWQKGQAAEYKVRCRLQAASLAGSTLADIGTNPHLDRFTTIRKARFYLDQEKSVEVDLHAVSERDDGTDLIVEVRAWDRELTAAAVTPFIEAQEATK